MQRPLRPRHSKRTRQSEEKSSETTKRVWARDHGFLKSCRSGARAAGALPSRGIVAEATHGWRWREMAGDGDGDGRWRWEMAMGDGDAMGNGQLSICDLEIGRSYLGSSSIHVNLFQRRRERAEAGAGNRSEIACRVSSFFRAFPVVGPLLRPSIRDRYERCPLVNRLPVRNLGSMASPLGAGSSALADA
jgi:hypothetical protein